MKKRLLAGIMSLLMAVSAIGIGLSAAAANDDGYTSFRLTDLPNQNYKYYSTLYGDCLNVGNASGGGYHILWKNGSTNHRIPLGKTLAINNLSLKFNNFKLLSGGRARFAIFMDTVSTYQYSMYRDSCIIVLDATDGKLYTVRYGGGSPNANIWIPIITDSRLSYENLKEKEFYIDFSVSANNSCVVTVSYGETAVSGTVPADVFDYVSNTEAVNLQFSAMENGLNENAEVNQKLDVVGYKYSIVESLVKRIEALPETITVETAGEVNECKALYDLLSAADKGKVTNYEKLKKALEQAAKFLDNTGWTLINESNLTHSLDYLNGPNRWPDNFKMAKSENGGLNLKWTNGTTNHRLVLVNALSIDKLQLKLYNLVRSSGENARLALYMWNERDTQYSMYRDSCVIILDAAAGMLYTVKYGGGNPNTNIWTPIITPESSNGFLKYDNIKGREIVFGFEVQTDGTCLVKIALSASDFVTGIIPADVFDYITDKENVYFNISAMENGQNENAKVTQSVDFIGFKEYAPSAAELLTERIAALPEKITSEFYAEVKICDALYQALSGDEKALVTNYEKLKAAISLAAVAADNSGYTIITGNADLSQSLQGINGIWSEFAVEKVENGGVRMKWTAAPSNRRIGTNTKYPLDGLNLKFNRLVRISGKANKFALLLSDKMDVQYSRYKEIVGFVFDFESGKLYKTDFDPTVGASGENVLTAIISDDRLLYENIAGREFTVSFDKRDDNGFDLTLKFENGESAAAQISAEYISKLNSPDEGAYFVFSSFSEDRCSQVIDYVGYKYVYKSSPDSATQAVIDGINALPAKPGISDGDKIRALKAAYDALKQYQARRVTNYGVLTSAIEMYSQALKEESRYDENGWYIPDLNDCGLLQAAGNDYVPPKMSEIPFNGGISQSYFYTGYGNAQSINHAFRLDGLAIRFNNFKILSESCNGFWLYVQTSTNKLAYWANSWDSALRGVAFLFGRDNTLYINGGNSITKTALITNPLLSRESLTQNEFTIGFKANGETFDVIVTVGDNDPLTATIEKKQLDAASVLDTENCYISTVCNYEAGDKLFKGSIDITGIKFVPYSPAEIAEWNAVIDLINKIPENITLADEGSLISALNAYLSLSKAEMRSFVTNYSKLTAAFVKLHDIKLKQNIDVYTGKAAWYTPETPAETVTRYVYIDSDENGGNTAYEPENPANTGEPKKVIKKRPIWRKAKGNDSAQGVGRLWWLTIPAAALVLGGAAAAVIICRKKKNRRG